MATEHIITETGDLILAEAEKGGKWKGKCRRKKDGTFKRLHKVNLSDFEAWKREEGFWVGEYTLLGGDGDPSESDKWPYRYDHYMGFIHLALDGPKLSQRNVFLYPPQHSDKCTADGPLGDSPDLPDVLGEGECGVNGNEKIFSADQ